MIQGGPKLRTTTTARTPFETLKNSTVEGETELDGLVEAPARGWPATGSTWRSRGTWWWLGWAKEGSKWEKNGQKRETMQAASGPMNRQPMTCNGRIGRPAAPFGARSGSLGQAVSPNHGDGWIVG